MHPTERASVLMLMPAAVLIVVILSSIALDFGAVHLRQRELDNIAASAANDAVGYGVSETDLRANGSSFALDPDRVETAIQDSLARRGLAGVTLAGYCIDSATGRGVVVRLSYTTQYLMARAIPGAPSSVTLQATQRASVESDRYVPEPVDCAVGP